LIEYKNFDLPVTKNNKDEIIAQTRCLIGWAFLYVSNWSGLVNGASKSSNDKINYFKNIFYPVLYFHVQLLKMDQMLTIDMVIIFYENGEQNMLAMRTSLIFTIIRRDSYNKNFISINASQTIINNINSDVRNDIK
jgi:hypothetical protein